MIVCMWYINYTSRDQTKPSIFISATNPRFFLMVRGPSSLHVTSSHVLSEIKTTQVKLFVLIDTAFLIGVVDNCIIDINVREYLRFPANWEQ